MLFFSDVFFLRCVALCSISAAISCHRLGRCIVLDERIGPEDSRPVCARACA